MLNFTSINIFNQVKSFLFYIIAWCFGYYAKRKILKLSYFSLDISYSYVFFFISLFNSIIILRLYKMQ